MAKISSKLRKWRKKQPKGAIMKPSTFEKIVERCIRQYGYGRKRCERIAGRAYWETAEAKHRRYLTKKKK